MAVPLVPAVHRESPVHPLAHVTREPRKCLWEVTRRCNLDCVHCDNHAKTQSRRELPLEKLKRVAGELKALGGRHVDVTGGEPLSMPGWDDFCSHLTSLGFEVAFITNGTLLDEETLSRLQAAGVGHVGISLDGCKTTHDATRRFADGNEPTSAFERTTAAIRTATRRLSVTVITQVNRTNLDELEVLGRNLGKMGVRRWQLQLAVPTVRVLACAESYVLAPSDLRTLTDFILRAASDSSIPFIHTSDNIGYATKAEAILRRKTSGPGLWLGCIAGLRSVAIKYDGTVRGCSLLPREFQAGDLHSESLAAIWNDPVRFALPEKLSTDHLSGGCKRCKHATFCRAGCTTMAYFSTGTIGDNPYCLRRLEECERESNTQAL